MKKLLFSSVLLLAANLLYGASMSSNLDDDHLFVFDYSKYGLETTGDSKYFNSGYVWGEIGDAVTILVPFDDEYKCQSFNKEFRIDNQTVEMLYAVQGSTNPRNAEDANPALNLTMPVQGAVLQLNAKENGWAYIFIRNSSHKQYLVYEDGEAIGYTFASMTTTESELGDVYKYTLIGAGDHNRLKEAGISSVESAEKEYFKITNPEAYEANQQIMISGYGVMKFAINKNSSYMVCSTVSKMVWGAVYFDKSEIGTIEVKNSEGNYLTLLDSSDNGPYYRLQINSTGKGSISYRNTTISNGSRSYVINSDDAVFDLKPVSGYKVDYIRVNGVDKTSELTENGTRLTIQGVSEQLTVDVNFVVDGEYATVIIGDTKHATFSINKDLDFSSVDEIKAYIASGFNHENGKILLTHVNEVPASTGLMVKGDAGSYIVPVKNTSYFYSNLFKPVLESTTIPEQSGDYTNYVLADGTEGLRFYRSDNASLSANKAYLQIPTSILGSQNNARTLGISYVDDGHYAGIEEIRANRTNNKVYNLNGQRVENPQRGIYIKNGKKVVVSILNNHE